MNHRKNDIAKYLNGELSPEEMHKLEMQALHDPFLADALEGAETITPDHFSEDVNFLDKKVHAWGTKKNYWPLRIAASILLIISITYLIFQMSPEDSNESLALKKENKAEEEVNNKKPDSAEDGDKKNKMEDKEDTQLKLQDKPVVLPKVAPEKVSESRQSLQPISKAALDTTSSTPQFKSEDIELGKVDDELPASKDLAILENEEVAQLKTETRRMRSDVLKKSASPTELSEADSRQKELPEAIEIAAKPLIGMEEYQNYLKKNVQYPKRAIDNNISGVVIVSFVVNRDSTLFDFKIEKSIGYGCDEELIRLIESGPGWAPGLIKGRPSNGRVSVTFIFDHKN